MRKETAMETPMSQWKVLWRAIQLNFNRILNGVHKAE